MQVEPSRMWQTSETPAFALDPALASYRSAPSYAVAPDTRSPPYPPNRPYPEPSENNYSSFNHSSAMHAPSPTSSSSSYSPSVINESLHHSSRFPPPRSSPILGRDGRTSPSRQLMPPPGLYTHPSQIQDSPPSPENRSSHSQFSSLPSMPRLPPILQVEKQQVTTSATQAASASRRRNEAHFMCPVPGCGSTFTRRFNLRGDLRAS